MGRQENKDEKLAKIRDAAEALFRERGFEATTTSMVAERAGVAKGTLFLYASNKEDLVALAFEHRLGPAIARAFETIPENASIPDEMMHVFGTFFALYAQMPDLARVFVRELLFPPPAALRVRDRVDDGFFVMLAQRVALRIAKGELRDVPAHFVATMWFGQYITALIAWLSGVLPSREAAEMTLRAAIDLSIRGLLPERRDVRNEGKGNEPCTPARPKRAASTTQRAPSAKTGSATSKRTASAKAATKRSGSRSRSSGR